MFLLSVTENLYNESRNPIEQGAIASSNGQNNDSTARIRAQGYIPVEPATSYRITSNIPYVFILQYQTDTTYLKISSGWQKTPYVMRTQEDAGNIRVVLAKNTGNTTKVTPDDFQWMKIKPQKV